MGVVIAILVASVFCNGMYPQLAVSHTCRPIIVKKTDQQAFGIVDRLADAEGNNIVSLIQRWPTAYDRISVEQWESIEALPSVLFHDIHNPNLPDIFVFVDAGWKVKAPVMVVDGKHQRDLFGKQHVWVVVLSLEKPKSSKEWTHEWMETHRDSTRDSVTVKEVLHNKFGIRKEPVTAKLSPLNVSMGHGNEVFGTVFRAIGSLLGMGTLPGESKAEVLKDVEFNMEFEKIWSDSKNRLYFSMQKIRINENTLNRIRVTVPDSIKTSAYVNFGNYSPSYFGASVGVGATFNADLNSGEHDTDVNGFIFGHVYLPGCRPRLPRPDMPPNKARNWFDSRSFSLVVGTRIRQNDLFDDIVIGGGIGHLIGKVGIIVGGHWLTRRRADGENTVKDDIRTERFFLALSVHL